MIDAICLKITHIIRKKMPEIDDERAEIINYGLQNIIGEVPKIFPVMVIAYVLGIFQLSLIAMISVLVYRNFSGGFHLNSHIGCLICSIIFFCGTVYLGKWLNFDNAIITNLIYISIWLANMVIIKIYAPADTENVPIIGKEQRKRQQIESYLAMTILIVIATLFIKDNVISNIIVYSTLLQSLGLTRIVYKITKNKYGHEVYNA